MAINSFTPNADDAVAKANQFNDKPPAGEAYAVINATITYTGKDKGTVAMVGFAFVDAKGNVYDSTQAMAVPPDPALQMQEIYPGAAVTGNEVIAIPIDADGLIRVRPGMTTDEVFVKTK